MKPIILLISTNFILYLISINYSLNRDFFNIDYVICLFLLHFKFRKTAVVLFAIFFISDLLLIFRQIFPFFRLDDIFYIIKFVFISSFAYKIIFLMVVSYIYFVSYFLLKKCKKNHLYLYFFIFTSLLFLVQNISIVIQPNSKIWMSSKFVKFVELQHDGFSQNLRMKQEPMQKLPYSQASKKFFEKNDSQNKLEKPHVFFIINESLGVPKNQAVLDQILSPLYDDELLIHDLKINQTSYVGPTVYAELRELCHAQPFNFNLKNLESGFDKCLPHLFQKRGYETIALHGALGTMYDRKYWYPRAGFQKTIFFENKKWKSQCYSFPGTCDWEIAQLISSIFSKANKPQFIYWLTLNSHSLYDKRDIFYNVFDCKAFKIEESTESCRNIKLQAQFFYVLAEMLKSSEIKNAEVVIVGDHAPVILNKSEKEKYFIEDNILLISFEVNKT